MGKGLKKAASASNTPLGRIQQNLTQQIKDSRKAGQDLTISPGDFHVALDLCLRALDVRSEDSSTNHLDSASEALEVLALLLPLTAQPKDQHVPPADRVSVVQSCWSLWAATSALQHRSQAAIEATLRLTEPDALDKDPAMLSLLDLLQSHRLASKRSLTCFALLLALAPPSLIQKRFPSLLQDLLDTLQQPELSSHAGKVAFQALQRLSSSSSAGPNQAQSVATLGSRLLEMDAQSRTALSLYVLGPLFGADDKWYHRLNTWLGSAQPTCSAKLLPAQLALTETAYRAAIIPRSSISDDMLNEAFSSSETHLRMSALAIVARPPSAKQSALAASDFDLLSKHFLTHLSKTADAEERNAIAGHWKVTLERLRASTYAAHRDSKALERDPIASDAESRKQVHEAHLADSRAFLVKAYSAFVASLQPLAPYRAQSSALRYLHNLLESAVVECWSNGSKIPPAKSVQVPWPFSIDQDIDMPQTLRNLTRCLTSTYEDIQTTAFRLISGFPRSKLPKCLTSKSTLEPRISALLTNGRKSQAQTAALLLQFEENSDATSALAKALQVARNEVDQVVQNISLAAGSCPMHGAIQCLAATMRADAVTPELKDELIALVDEVYRATSPIMTNTAPEGTEVADHEEARAFEAGQEELDEDLQVEASGGSEGSVKHKVIMSACWRAMRQAGLVLERIVSLTSSDPTDFRRLWSLESLESVAERFHRYLLYIRHRGCFTAIAGSYEAFLQTLSRVTSWPELPELPESWLKKRLVDSTDDTLSFTRRSAGLPYLILATLVTSRSRRTELLQLAMGHLFQVARDSTTEATNNVQVHSINTLRSIFLESKLGPAVLPYAEQGFLLAIHSFRSEYWPTRNAALLLYSALVQRAFTASSKKSTSETSTWANRVSRNDFFRDYPIEPALLRELDYSLETIGINVTEGNQQSSLFAILLLLSKLATATRLPSQTFATDPLLTRVRACLKSRVWKVREVAADATSGLVTPDEFPMYMEVILANVTSQGENQLHGHLLSFLRICDCHSLTRKAWHQATSLLDGKASVCLGRTFAVRQAYCKLSLSLLQKYPEGASAFPHTAAVLSTVFRHSDALTSRHGAFTALPEAASLFLALEVSDNTVVELFLQPALPSAVQEVALEHYEKHHHTAATAIQNLVLSDQVAQSVRLKALELLDVDYQFLSSDQIGALLDQCRKTTRGPLTEALMPLLASQIEAATEAQKLECARQILQSSHEDESESIRAAAARSLFPLQGSEVDKILMTALLRLLQDDDTDVRFTAERKASQYLKTQAVHHSGVALEGIWKRLRSLLSLQEMVENIVLVPLDLRTLRVDENVLFIDERANLFIDDSSVLSFTQAAVLDSTAVAMPEATHISITEKLVLFQQALQQKYPEDHKGQNTYEDYLSDPLGLSSEVSWYGAALRLKVACQAAGMSPPQAIGWLLL